jgi:hypothetical protein
MNSNNNNSIEEDDQPVFENPFKQLNQDYKRSDSQLSQKYADMDEEQPLKASLLSKEERKSQIDFDVYQQQDKNGNYITINLTKEVLNQPSSHEETKNLC